MIAVASSIPCCTISSELSQSLPPPLISQYHPGMVAMFSHIEQESSSKMTKTSPANWWHHKYTRHGKSQTLYTAPCNGVVSHGLKLGVFGFLLTTYTKTKAKQMSPRSSRAMCMFIFMRIFIFPYQFLIFFPPFHSITQIC